jgi:general secretion pathway protein B
MSYILDALKKADQEREQGQVPGLHAQQTLHTDADAPAAASGLSPLVWAGIGVALTLAGVLTWLQWPAAGSARAPAAPVQQGLPSVVVARPSATAPFATPDTSPTATAPVPAGDVALHVEAPPADTRGSAAAPGVGVSGARPGERNAERHSAPAEPSSQGDAPAPQAKSGALPKLADLPDAVRKDLPALNVGGAMHSPTPSQRMLVLNGQVFHEGDSPHPGLTLEEIRLKSAVLNFQGQRFELPF